MSKTTQITVTVSADALLKIVTGAYKGITLAGVTTPTVPEKPKTYDATTCTTIKTNAKLDSLLESYKGEGALKKLMTENNLDYTVASPLLSAWKAARKAKREELFIVPNAASQAQAFVESLMPKPVLIKAAH